MTPAEPADPKTFQTLERHLRTITTLAKRRVFVREDLPKALAEITELCSLALEVQRSSIWILVDGHSALRCLHLHDQTAATQGPQGDLPADPFPTYFRELLAGHVIAAHNARTDPATREFADVYLKPLDIHSMLDAPIRLHGELIGVVCQEHTGAPRHWLPEDIAFAGFIANAVSMALESFFLRGGSLPGFTPPEA